MSVERKSRTGKTYYLHVQTTAAGKSNYFFSTDPEPPLATSIPDGYEVYETVAGQVFLRKKTVQSIQSQELALVEDALRQHGEPWEYRLEVKKNMIVVHGAGDMGFSDALVAKVRGRGLSSGEKLRHASYMALLRFVLIDKKTREFVPERFCFLGRVDDWIPIGAPGPLSVLVRKFVKQLGRDSFFELF